MTFRKVQVWVACRHPKTQILQFLLLLTHPGRGSFWQPITGGVDEGEAIEVAALRELSEETGLRPQISGEAPTPGGAENGGRSTHLQPIPADFQFESRGNQVHEFPFFIDISAQNPTSLPQIQIDPHEHTDFAWVDAETAGKRVAFPSNLKVLESIIAQMTTKSR